MMIDIMCHKCESSFEIDAAELIDGSERIKCPNCNAKAPQSMVDDVGNALGELCKSVAALRNRFSFSMAVETDDLPAPYDADEEEEDEEEDDDLLDREGDRDEEEEEP